MDKSTLKEARKHGTPIYPVSFYDIACPPDAPLLDLHWHDELELLLVTEGSAVFRVDLQDYELRAGEAIFVNAGELHSGYVTNDQACSFTAVVFHSSLFSSGTIDYLFDRYISPVLERRYEVPAHLRREPGAGLELLTMLDTLIEIYNSDKLANELMIKGLLYSMMSELIGLGGPAARTKPEQEGYRIDRLKTVIEYIEQNYAEPIPLHKLAELARMSESYFCRFFKRITTKSPIEYMNSYRVQQAAARLRQSDAKIMEVALDVGFNSLSYFNTVFRQRFGCTPREYRSRLQKSG
ncbi:AraC family transcriptional regulator [Paenibacillus glycanilyticus]|uniref:HTH-type transcriptional regulator YdeC n=1 Tax=Paenibacillus glycanilyticus TaxID=126569 RepID=A0ABQ6G791_9BACL|nr:AraC family transcriptional regulator [Paenibacillus glycanilyticus]GLX66432.1 putative HTH-type transcriptional regulator YdeC [Paenibacillus glycanilyticus]